VDGVDHHGVVGRGAWSAAAGCAVAAGCSLLGGGRMSAAWAPTVSTASPTSAPTSGPNARAALCRDEQVGGRSTSWSLGLPGRRGRVEFGELPVLGKAAGGVGIGVGHQRGSAGGCGR